METLVVEAFSNKFGPSFCVGNVWHVSDKKAGLDLTCRAGDKIEVERNGKWIKSFKIVGSGEVPQRPNTPLNGSRMPQEASKSNPGVQGQICRGNSVNAILGSPAIANMLKDKDMSEGFQILGDMVEKMAHYIATGERK